MRRSITPTAARSTSPSARRNRSTRFRPARSATRCSRCPITFFRAIGRRRRSDCSVQIAPTADWLVQSSQPEIESAISHVMISFGLPPLTLEIADGDIAAERTDAVVNAANSVFWMGSGVAGALKARGGQQIEADAMAQGPVEPGECVITSGGRLPARHVIHAAVMGQDLQTSATLIDRATCCALEIAEAHQLQ